MRKKLKFMEYIKWCVAGVLSVSVSLTYAAHMTFQLFTGEHPWLLTADLGNQHFQNMYQGDGQTFAARLALGRSLLMLNQAVFGMEVAVQSGNTMRLGLSQSVLDELGGLPIQSVVKPLIDFLWVSKLNVMHASPLMEVVKLGGAYRQWQFTDHNTIASHTTLALEVQAGFEYNLYERASLHLMYQQIFGGNPHFQVNTTQGTGSVSNIPMQYAFLFGATFSI